MRVLHIIPGLANASGPAQALRELVLHLEQLGVDVSVAYLSNRLENQEPPDLVHGRVYPCRAVGLIHWGYSPDLKRLLEEQIQTFDIVHIHSLWLYPGWIASRLARRFGIPYLIRPAGSLEPVALQHKSLPKRLYYQLIEKKIINSAARIHAVSDQEAHNIEPFQFTPPSVVVPNGILPDRFDQPPSRTEARSLLGLPKDVPLLLYLGRLHPIKGMEFLAELVQKLTPLHPDLHLAIAGPDQHDYAQRLKAHYQSAGIAPQITYLGEVRAEKKLAAYGAADLFVLPSKSENFGLVVAEALATGTPAIVSEHTPWQSLNTHQAGAWLPLDSARWVDAISPLLTSTTALAAAGARGKKLATEEFAWQSIAQKQLKIYEEITATRRQPSTASQPRSS